MKAWLLRRFVAGVKSRICFAVIFLVFLLSHQPFLCTVSNSSLLCMENILIKETTTMPSVYFSAQEGILDIRGKCIPENTVEFFDPMVDWVNAYVLSPQSQTQVSLRLEYYNTSTSRYIAEILKNLENITRDNKGDVQVSWIYESGDLDLEEAGQDFKSLSQLPFELIEVDVISHDRIASPMGMSAAASVADLTTERALKAQSSLQKELDGKVTELSVMSSISSRIRKKLKAAEEEIARLKAEVVHLKAKYSD